MVSGGRMLGAGAGTIPTNVVPVTLRLFCLAAHTPLYFLKGDTLGVLGPHYDG